MPASGIKLADANIWLALVFSDHQHHSDAKTWFKAQEHKTCVFCRITQMAILRHLTNSKIMGKFVQNQQSAWRIYDELANDPRASSHKLWTDAYLAAFAVANQLQLVTFDQGFHRFAGLDLFVLNS